LKLLTIINVMRDSHFFENNKEDNIDSNIFINNKICDDVFLEEGEIFVCNECEENEVIIQELNERLDELEYTIDELHKNKNLEFINHDEVVCEYEKIINELEIKLKELQFKLDYQKEINTELKINHKILKLRLKERNKYEKLVFLDLDNKITRRHSS